MQMDYTKNYKINKSRKINFECIGSYIDSSKWLKAKKLQQIQKYNDSVLV